jgi:hypothetical protein
MAKHEWRVTKLCEFFPKNPGLLGMNTNRTKIQIRLRPSNSPDSFYTYEHCLGTMIHELTHMKIGPHSTEFYKLMEELNQECDSLISKGITGAQGVAFAEAGEGNNLGDAGVPKLSRKQVKVAAASAAEKRMRNQKIMGGGGRKLGGCSSADASLSPRSLKQKVLAAAERRRHDEEWCRCVMRD